MTGLTLDSGFTLDQPFYESTTTVLDILGKWHVAINGRTYMLDTAYFDQFGFHPRQSVPLLRQQADQSAAPSESSINFDDLWRRSQDSWHLGAGQSFFDRGDSVPQRFNQSQGVDVFTRWQISLLNGTQRSYSSADTNFAVVTVGSYLYAAAGVNVQYTQDITVASPSWTTVSGFDASTVTSLASDGYTVYAAQAGGVFTATRGAGAATGAPYNALVASVVRYCNGRLMAAGASTDSNKIYNITAGGAAPSAHFPHPNPDFAWVDFTSGQTCIYAAGYSGDKSLIYRIPLKSDGTGLDAPAVAAELPDGEIVRSIQSYLGFVLIGSDKGVRLATIADSLGNLTLGSLIPTTSAVYCFEPQDRFVWYGLTNYTGAASGLGRVDLANLTAPLTPAYASDLMAEGQGRVTSAATFQNRRVFVIQGLGIITETATPVSSGYIDSGQITYRLPDDKVAMFLDVKHDGTGSHSAAVSTDGGSFNGIGTNTTIDDAFNVGRAFGTRFEVRLTLTTVASESPVIRSLTLRAYPSNATVEQQTLPIMLAENLTLLDGEVVPFDPGFELEELVSLRTTRPVVPLQVGPDSTEVLVDDFDWHPKSLTSDFLAWNGTLLLTVKKVVA